MASGSDQFQDSVTSLPPPRGRPRTIPERGDVSHSLAAKLMDLSPADLERLLPDLLARGFPQPDPTTGRFCVEAIDRWRRLRHPTQFPELTGSPSAVNADAVFAARLAKMRRPDG
jgi:hypothetical protein